MIETQLEGEANCMEQGARLFTPRSTRAMEFFEKFETKHISQDGMFHYAKQESRQAVGLIFEFEVGNNEGSLFYG